MKAALVGRSSLHTVTGGDSIQMVKTAEALHQIGVQADIYLASDKIDYGKYDLLHFFNLLRPADHLYHIRKSNKPYVVSTIYLDYTGFDRHGRSLPSRVIFSILGKYGSEYVKNLYRYMMGQDTLMSPEYFTGHLQSMLNVIQGAEMILPNSGSELKRLTDDLGFRGPYSIIPNGIDEQVFGHIPENIQREDKVLCVAQVTA